MKNLFTFAVLTLFVSSAQADVNTHLVKMNDFIHEFEHASFKSLLIRNVIHSEYDRQPTTIVTPHDASNVLRRDLKGFSLRGRLPIKTASWGNNPNDSLNFLRNEVMSRLENGWKGTDHTERKFSHKELGNWSESINVFGLLEKKFTRGDAILVDTIGGEENRFSVNSHIQFHREYYPNTRQPSVTATSFSQDLTNSFNLSSLKLSLSKEHPYGSLKARNNVFSTQLEAVFAKPFRFIDGQVTRVAMNIFQLLKAR